MKNNDKYIFIDDFDALQYLEYRNHLPSFDGVFRIPKEIKLKEKELIALLYLVDEWDYGFERI